MWHVLTDPPPSVYIAFPPLATERPQPSHPEGTLSTTLGVSFTGHWLAHTFPTLRGFHTLGSFLYWPLTGPHLPHTEGFCTLWVSLLATITGPHLPHTEGLHIHLDFPLLATNRPTSSPHWGVYIHLEFPLLATDRPTPSPHWRVPARDHYTWTVVELHG